MNRRCAGVIFYFIASLLFSTNYICISVLSINFSWEMSKSIIGRLPIILSIISFLVGTVYIVFAELKKE